MIWSTVHELAQQIHDFVLLHVCCWKQQRNLRLKGVITSDKFLPTMKWMPRYLIWSVSWILWQSKVKSDIAYLGLLTKTVLIHRFYLFGLRLLQFTFQLQLTGHFHVNFAWPNIRDLWPLDRRAFWLHVLLGTLSPKLNLTFFVTSRRRTDGRNRERLILTEKWTEWRFKRQHANSFG